MTLSMWLTSSQDTSSYIVRRGAKTKLDYALMRTATGQLNFFVETSSGPVSLRSTTTAPLNEWFQVAMCLDGSSMSIRIKYIDGRPESYAEQPYSDRAPRRGHSLIIGSHAGDALFYAGKVDDIRIYSRAIKP